MPLPIANPAAPPPGSSKQDPGPPVGDDQETTSGSGDFAALLAMLAGAVTTPGPASDAATSAGQSSSDGSASPAAMGAEGVVPGGSPAGRGPLPAMIPIAGALVAGPQVPPGAPVRDAEPGSATAIDGPRTDPITGPADVSPTALSDARNSSTPTPAASGSAALPDTASTPATPGRAATLADPAEGPGDPAAVDDPMTAVVRGLHRTEHQPADHADEAGNGPEFDPGATSGLTGHEPSRSTDPTAPTRPVAKTFDAVGPGAPAATLLASPRAEAPAPAPTDATAAPMAPPTVPDQIVSAVVPLHGRGDGRHEVTLELRPDDLGTIRVEVSVEHQIVHLTLHAVEPATGRLLSAALPELRSALADAGLTAGHVGVGPGGGGGAGGRRPSPVRRPDRAERAGLPEHNSQVRTVRTADPGRLDLFL
jgi:hypothetical protein